MNYYDAGIHAALHAPVCEDGHPYDWPYIRLAYADFLHKVGDPRRMWSYREFLSGYKQVVDDTRQWAAWREQKQGRSLLGMSLDDVGS